MNKANTYLIEQIKERMEGSPADALSDILPLSKEAIYRRLRGEVLFTLDEAVTIAKELNISLDSIITKENNSCTFELTMPQFEKDPSKAYIDAFNNIANIMNALRLEDSQLFYVRPSLAPIFTYRYDNLFKFNYLRWLYLSRKLTLFIKKFSNTIVTENLRNAVINSMEAASSLNNTILLSELVFEYQLKEFNHFYNINILNKDDLILIANELRLCINDLETMATIGKLYDGAKLNLYLIDVTQDFTFGFSEGAKRNIAFIKFIDLNQGVTENKAMYNTFRSSFYDMKGYATLISESGSSKRTAFFSKQRAIVDEFISRFTD